jgi:hypothetical protein
VTGEPVEYVKLSTRKLILSSKLSVKRYIKIVYIRKVCVLINA